MKRGSARNPRPKACLSFRACRGIPWKGTILKPDRGRSKAFPFPHGVSPVSVPLIAMQQGIHGKPRWAGTLSVSQSGAFSDCVTRFRGGALRHAKFPKTSYKVQLLDTLKHAACVFREPAKGKPFVGRGATEHILPDAQIFVRLKYVSVGTSGRRRGLIFLSNKVLVSLMLIQKKPDALRLVDFFMPSMLICKQLSLWHAGDGMLP